MDNKPMFCSECGARLTGSAAFCPTCGAKQELATAAVSAAPQPVAIPVVIPQAAPAVDVKPTPAPAMDVKPGPVSSPETSLATSKRARSFALLALGATLLAVLLELIGRHVIDSEFFIDVWTRFGIGWITAWILPLITVFLVSGKDKRLASAGFITAVAVIVLQSTVTIINSICHLHFLGPLNQLLNGRNLVYYFSRLPRILRGQDGFSYLTGLGANLFYFLKNILCAVGCMAAAKRGR